jgi:hypothetical protein
MDLPILARIRAIAGRRRDSGRINSDSTAIQRSFHTLER